MRRFIIMLVALATITPSLSGCFGKFALTRKVYTLNASVPDRILRNVVMWAFIFVPVYWVTGVVDLFIFNALEFWAGTNPMAAGERSFHYADGNTDFRVRAAWQDGTITYTIDRYAGDHYLDTLVIRSDRSGDAATATYRHNGTATTIATRGSGSATALGSALLLPETMQLARYD
jgi:hypothetical protein